MNRKSCPGYLFFIHTAGKHNFGTGMRDKYINNIWGGGFEAQGFEFNVVVIYLALVLGI